MSCVYTQCRDYFKSASFTSTFYDVTTRTPPLQLHDDVCRAKPDPGAGFESYPRSASSGHSGPEEAPPVGVLEDVGQDAGEQPGAVQNRLTLPL